MRVPRIFDLKETSGSHAGLPDVLSSLGAVAARSKGAIRRPRRRRGWRIGRNR
jgi:hypothetical protein